VVTTITLPSVNIDAGAPLADMTHQRKIRLVEDGAHAHGSEWKGRKMNVTGDLNFRFPK